MPGAANGIGFEDLVVIEDLEYLRAVVDERPYEVGFAQALDWVAVQAALLSRSRRAAGKTSCRCGRTEMAIATETLRIGVLGVGRIGRMHAELLGRQVPGAAVTAV